MSKEIIGVEEHYITPDFEQEITGADTPQAIAIRKIIKRTENLGAERIAEMDAAGENKQIISLTAPGTQNLNATEGVRLAVKSNDLLGQAVRSHPDRFGGFATLPTADPEAAAAELRRTVEEYGFSGALINGSTQEHYLDEPQFEPILAVAEELDVPLYIHPGLPPKAVTKSYYQGNFSPAVAFQFNSAGFGWHIDTAIHIIRMVLAGVFDRHPNLNVMTGHLGEGAIFALQRLDTTIPTEMSGLKHPVSYYMKHNVYYSISGYASAPQFTELLSQVGADHVLFSVDYPYVDTQETIDFVENMHLSAEDEAKIMAGNAKKLLHLN